MMLIRTFLQIYIYLLIADAIFSYFPDLEKHNWRKQVKKIADFTCNPIRKQLPPNLPIDFSPILVIFAIELLFFLW
jgi:YggT family protein